MDDKKIGAAEFSDVLFQNLQDANDPTSGAITLALQRAFPWEHCQEDRWSAEQQLGRYYERLKLKPPKFAWGPSPYAVYSAMNMLRAVQTGQRHKFIEAIVPVEDQQAAAKSTLLEAIINKDLTVTTGAAVKDLLNWRIYPHELLVIYDLRKYLTAVESRTKTPLRGWAAAKFTDNTMWPTDHHECIGPRGSNLKDQAIFFVPYVHLCWFCCPPVETITYEDGHLETMRFRDGYVVHCSPVPKDKVLPAEHTAKLLTDGQTKEIQPASLLPKQDHH